MYNNETIDQATAVRILANLGLRVQGENALQLARKIQAEVKAIEVDTGKAVGLEQVKGIAGKLHHQDSRPELVVGDMLFVSNINEIEKILSNDTNNPIYQHNGRLVRLEGTPAHVNVVNQGWLASQIGKLIKFAKYDPVTRTDKEVYPPGAVLSTILRQKDTWPFKPLPDDLLKPPPQPDSTPQQIESQPTASSSNWAKKQKLNKRQRKRLKAIEGGMSPYQASFNNAAIPDRLAWEVTRELCDAAYDNPHNSRGVVPGVIRAVARPAED